MKAIDIVLGDYKAVKKKYDTLKESHKELIEALKSVRLEVGVLEHNWSLGARLFMPKVIKAIENAKQL